MADRPTGAGRPGKSLDKDGFAGIPPFWLKVWTLTDFTQPCHCAFQRWASLLVPSRASAHSLSPHVCTLLLLRRPIVWCKGIFASRFALSTSSIHSCEFCVGDRRNCCRSCCWIRDPPLHRSVFSAHVYCRRRYERTLTPCWEPQARTRMLSTRPTRPAARSKGRATSFSTKVSIGTQLADLGALDIF